MTLMYGGRRGWVSSKVITRVISLGSRSLEPQHLQSSTSGTPPKIGWNVGELPFSAENLQYL